MKLSPPDLASFQHICRNLREKDVLELTAEHGEVAPDDLAHRLLNAWRVCGVAGHVVSLDEPIALAVIVQLTPRAASAGLLATNRWKEIVRPYSVHVKTRFLPSLVERGVRRLEARAWEGHHDARRWLTWMGATEECRVPQWGANGETFIQYGWLADVFGQKGIGGQGDGCAAGGQSGASGDHRHVISATG